MQKSRKDRAFTPEQKNDARNAIQLLVGRGLTLTECVRIALQLPGGSAIMEVTIDHAIDKFLQSIRVRPMTLAFYQQHLWRFQNASSIRTVDQLTSKHIAEYISQLSGSKPQAYRALSAWLRWCWKQDPPYARDDIIQRVPKPRTKIDKIRFLTVDDCRRVLQIHTYKYAIALGLFAGIRMYELGRLDWNDVNRVEKIIRIHADVGKTNRTRIIEKIPDTLWRHIEAAPKSGPVLDILPDNLGKAIRRHLPTFPANGLRHTFATYHVAAYRMPGNTALILGHEGSLQMLYNHYRGLATAAESEKFWEL